MPFTTRRTSADSPPDPSTDLITEPSSNGTTLVQEREASAPPVTDRPASTAEETRFGRFRRKAHRARLHGYAIAAVALVAYLIALAVSNTAHVKVGWVFGSSHVSLVWLVLFTAILGWLLGLATSSRFRWRTRAPRPGGKSS